MSKLQDRAIPVAHAKHVHAHARAQLVYLVASCAVFVHSVATGARFWRLFP